MTRADIDGSIRQHWPRTKNSENTVRPDLEPPLALRFPSPRMDLLRPTVPEDPCYTFAAFALHHQHQMTDGLWVALIDAWPVRRQGKRPNYYADRFAAQAHRQGAPVEAIAAAWSISPDSARKKVDRGLKASHDWATVERPAVVVVASDQAAAIYEIDDPRESWFRLPTRAPPKPGTNASAFRPLRRSTSRTQTSATRPRARGRRSANQDGELARHGFAGPHSDARGTRARTSRETFED